jgi:hypothetical protein
MSNPPASSLRARQIGESDIDSVAQLLAKGFQSRSRAFWLTALTRLARRAAPPDHPRFGYMLESAGNPVGVILLIFSSLNDGDVPAIRCNLSSWYVEPPFRGYAALLAAKALRHKHASFVNVSPAPHTRAIIEAQGFTRVSRGLVIAPGPLQVRGARARILPAAAEPAAPFQPFERDLLRDHAGFGCHAFWCETAERAFPFVFRPRIARKLIPCAQLIYCRDLADLARFARPIGWHLARRGHPLMVLDADGPIPGMVGKYIDGLMPKYARGPHPPRLGDLAYTEAALFGI